jgi:hypothetical protein
VRRFIQHIDFRFICLVLTVDILSRDGAGECDPIKKKKKKKKKEEEFKKNKNKIKINVLTRVGIDPHTIDLYKTLILVSYSLLILCREKMPASVTHPSENVACLHARAIHSSGVLSKHTFIQISYNAHIA